MLSHDNNIDFVDFFLYSIKINLNKRLWWAQTEYVIITASQQGPVLLQSSLTQKIYIHPKTTWNS